MTSSISSNGVPLSSIFAAYSTGTKARVTGIQDNGQELSNLYAPLYLGSAAVATGIESINSDLNTLYAAIGTVSYALPIQGQTYTQSINIITGSGASQIGFRILTGTTWEVYGTNSQGAANSFASGPIPSAAVTVKYTLGLYTIDSGFTDALGVTTNDAPTPTAISSNPTVHYGTGTATPTSGSRDRNYPLTIDFYDASSVDISHTTCNIVGETEGSV
jgi:hypothetical protein